MDRFTEALGWYFVFLFSTTLHEAAHAWAAKKGGDLTAYHGGQVSLDPLPHIKREPLGMVVFPLLFSLVLGWPFGFASAPYDPIWARNYPRRAAMMALAGPAANFLLVGLAALVIRIGMFCGGFEPPDLFSLTAITLGAPEGFWASGALLVSMFFSLNLILAVFNLLPLPPLDGSTGMALLLKEETATTFQNFIDQPMSRGIGLLLAWNIFGPLSRPLFLAALNLLYP